MSGNPTYTPPPVTPKPIDICDTALHIDERSDNVKLGQIAPGWWVPGAVRPSVWCAPGASTSPPPDDDTPESTKWAVRPSGSLSSPSRWYSSPSVRSARRIRVDECSSCRTAVSPAIYNNINMSRRDKQVAWSDKRYYKNMLYHISRLQRSVKITANADSDL